MDNFMMEGAIAFQHRPGRSERKTSDGVDLTFTRDRYLISQYKRLRKSMYEIDPRFVGFRFFNDAHAEYYEDPDDQMLIVQHDGEVMGGGCLRISTPQRPIMLDLENDILPEPGKFYFSLRDRFPELELHRYAFAEFNRIVLHPSLRKGHVTRQMFKLVLQRCIEYRVRYMFATSDRVRTRLYKQIYHDAGEGGVRKDVDIAMRDEYEGVKMYLMIGDMKMHHITPRDPEAEALLSPSSAFEFD